MYWLVLIYAVEAGTTSISGNFKVDGQVTCEEVSADQLQASDLVSFGDYINANSISSQSITAQKVYVDTITSPTGKITVYSDVKIGSEATTSFLEKPHYLLEHNSFEESSHNWTGGNVTACQGDHFLKVTCSAKQAVKKQVVGVHQAVRVSGTFHMLGWWSGQKGFLKVDNTTVWSQEGHTSTESLSLCGEFPDARVGIHFDLVVPHTQELLELTLGSTLESCGASFGVDDVMIYIS